MNMPGLEKKIALVTGGGGGIGGEVCKFLGAAGATVGIADQCLAAAETVAAEIEQDGGRAHPIHMDVTNLHSVNSGLASLEASAGAVSILVNAAGWDTACEFVDTSPESWDKLIAINLIGPINVHHAVVRGMIERSKGVIVNVSSDAARVGSAGEAVYSAAKGGLISFSKTLAREVAVHGINVNVVCPGLTDTPLLDSVLGSGAAGERLRKGAVRAIPLKRIGQPEEVAAMIVFLASEQSSYITGQVISVSGGLTMHG